MAIPIRSCVGCRKPHPTSDLIRLQVDHNGHLAPSPRPGPQTQRSRSAWVCPQLRCINRIQRNPRGLFRALRLKPPPNVKNLQQRMVDQLDEDAARLLKQCHRHGLLVSGRHRLLGSSDLTFLVLAEDASAHTVRQIREACGQLMASPIGLDRVALGALIGKSPRSIVGARHGHSSELLRRCLQRRANIR